MYNDEPAGGARPRGDLPAPLPGGPNPGDTEALRQAGREGYTCASVAEGATFDSVFPAQAETKGGMVEVLGVVLTFGTGHTNKQHTLCFEIDNVKWMIVVALVALASQGDQKARSILDNYFNEGKQ